LEIYYPSINYRAICIGAARNFIKAIRANAGDPRALKLLEQLFGEHPEITVLGKVEKWNDKKVIVCFLVYDNIDIKARCFERIIP
jgi:hypothetical protein